VELVGGVQKKESLWPDDVAFERHQSFENRSDPEEDLEELAGDEFRWDKISKSSQTYPGAGEQVFWLGRTEIMGRSDSDKVAWGEDNEAGVGLGDKPELGHYCSWHHYRFKFRLGCFDGLIIIGSIGGSCATNEICKFTKMIHTTKTT